VRQQPEDNSQPIRAIYKHEHELASHRLGTGGYNQYKYQGCGRGTSRTQRTIFLAPWRHWKSIVYFYCVRTVISGKSYRPSSDKYLFVGGILIVANMPKTSVVVPPRLATHQSRPQRLLQGRNVVWVSVKTRRGLVAQRARRL